MRLIDADELLKVINDPEELRYAVLHAEPHDAIPIEWLNNHYEVGNLEQNKVIDNLLELWRKENE